jgi:hypothetical protein
MDQVRKDNLKDRSYSSYTSIVTNSEQKSSEVIWQAWHLRDNSQLKSDSSRLFKTKPVYEYLHQFGLVYNPGQKLWVDEEMIPQGERLRFRTYNPGKITMEY